MKLSLHIGMVQQLTLTPQLQQAIRLLQLSKAELDLEIALAVESNSMLELCESTEQAASRNYSAEINYSPATSSWEETAPEQPDIAAVNSSWEDLHYSDIATPKSTQPQNYNSDTQANAPITLRDHLYWQLNLTNFSAPDKAIAELIIDAIDDDGYLICALDEIQHSLKSTPTELAEIEAILHRIQAFDPLGVAARNLAECLQIQLRALPTTTLHLPTAQLIVAQHLDLLAKKKYLELANQLNITESELAAAILILKNLHPKPGTTIGNEKYEYLTPDIIVNKNGNNWVVKLNPELEAKIRINPYYAAMVNRATPSKDHKFLQDQLNEAKWFLKSLHNRNETLLKVATCIVEQQQEFLTYGDKAMRPLILQDIAAQTGLHESTISRITTKKYIHTPQGMYELKHFFSSHITTKTGGDCSSTAIRAMIKKLVTNEPADNPLSDSKITELLAKQGIEIARRTVTKYREALAIPASSQRKIIFS